MFKAIGISTEINMKTKMEKNEVEELLKEFKSYVKELTQREDFDSMLASGEWTLLDGTKILVPLLLSQMQMDAIRGKIESGLYVSPSRLKRYNKQVKEV